MKKLISYSLWGDSKLYCQGAIDNIECAQLWYPDYICRFYIAEDCPALKPLSEMNCEIVIMPKTNKIDRSLPPFQWHNQFEHVGMMWRFLAMSDENVERVIFRDTDSRLSEREALAVREWEESNMSAHRMHECKEHWNSLIMGGMWGIKGGIISNIENLINYYLQNVFRVYRKEAFIFVDLWLIMDMIWPIIKNDCMGHGFGHDRHFKVPGFVGKVEHEEWRYEKF